MPRNASGTYTLPVAAFVAGTTILSASVNSNYSDISTALTQSLATTGVSTMTGPIKAAVGVVTAPTYTFTGDTGTGFYLSGTHEIGIAINGVHLLAFTSTGITGNIALVGNLSVSGTLTKAGNVVDAFATGTAIIFASAAAPTGWTKDVAQTDYALRLVDSTGGGLHGAVAFTTAFDVQTVTGTVGDTALSIAQMPLHGHPYRVSTDSNGSSDPTGGAMLNTAAAATASAFTGTPSNSASETIGGTGGGAVHTHSFAGTSINLNVKYMDVIRCTKD